jgi:hypothetical protein
MQDKQFLLWLTKAAGVQAVSADAGTSPGFNDHFLLS